MSSLSVPRKQSIKKTPSSSARKKRRKKISTANLDDVDHCSRHYVSSLDKQILFRDIITNFVEWPTWQKRLLLCRITEKTSSTLLSTLTTVLEPIFHRDFEVKSKCGFDSSLIKNFMGVSTSSLPSTFNTPSSLNALSPITEPIDVHLTLPSVTVDELQGNETVSSGQSANRAVKQVPSMSAVNSVQRRVHEFVSSCRKEFSSVNCNVLGRGNSHDHALDRNSTSLSTMEFLLYPQKQNVTKLGALMKPLTQVNDIPHVKQYKHHKWWLPPIDNSHTLKRVSKRSLLRSFKKITDEFVSNYMSWNNAEKGDFMLHIVDYCEPDEIKFFANCIYQRVENIEDINNVNDNVLLNIFSYLNVDELATVAQVCKRWEKLASSGQIWEQRCYILAYKHDQLDVMRNLEMSSVELDWKQLYNELEKSILLLKSFNAQVSTSLPSTTSEENTSGHCESFVDESECHHLEEVHEAEIDDKDSDILLECRLSDMVIKDDGPRAPSKSTFHDHVRFALEENESKLQLMLSSEDNLKDDYATEEELKERDNGVQEEEKQDQKDVAFDVRVKLVQASNRLQKKIVSAEPEPDEDIEYHLIQISNIKTVNRVRKLEGHVDAVLCLQFDSKRVVTGSSDRSVKLWDIRSGRCFRSLVGHQGGVRCLKFDEKYIATGSWDTTVIIWDVVNFALIYTIIEHSDCVSCIEFTSTLLITASHDTTICIFEKDSWTVLARLEEHTAPVSCLCLITENELLSGSHDRLVILWDLEACCMLRKFDGLKHSCLCLKICGSLVAAGASDGTITFWDLSSSNMEGCIVAHNAAVNALCFVQTRFFSAGENAIKEWDLSTCTWMRSLEGHTGQVLCLRASAKRVVSGSADGTVRVWDMACKLQQIGRNYDELNKNIIPTEVLNETQFKELHLAK